MQCMRGGGEGGAACWRAHAGGSPVLMPMDASSDRPWVPGSSILPHWPTALVVRLYAILPYVFRCSQGGLLCVHKPTCWVGHLVGARLGWLVCSHTHAPNHSLSRGPRYAWRAREGWMGLCWSWWMDEVR